MLITNQCPQKNNPRYCSCVVLAQVDCKRRADMFSCERVGMTVLSLSEGISFGDAQEMLNNGWVRKKNYR